MRFPRRIALTALILSLAGVLSGAPAAFAQASCPRPEGVAKNPLETPGVTAAQAAANPTAANLEAFALAGKKLIASSRTFPANSYVLCLFKNHPNWNSGSIYVTGLTPDGRLLFHPNNANLGGRQLNPALWGQIAGAAGLTRTGFSNPDGGALPGGGHAVGYIDGLSNFPHIVVAGLDIQESSLMKEVLDPGAIPAVTARDVVDRATLKAFVNGAGTFMGNFFRDRSNTFSKLRSVFRTEHWRHGEIYLFLMDESGYTFFHGGDPGRYELATPTDTLRDVVTGNLILPQIIDAAKKPGGGFVQYYFDNPDDDTDSADVPKVTFARSLRNEVTGNSFIIGAGIYRDPGAVSEAVCPRPAGVAKNPLETPAVTAAQAAGSAENLKNFALAGKRYLASIRPGPELAYSRCLFRHEGPWKSGATYAATISTNGRVVLHSGNMALSGLPLKAAVWRAIAAATGAAALQTTGDFGKPDGGALPAAIGGGYAVGFKRTVGGGTGILVAGLDIGKSDLAPETVDPGNPPIRADQVVDRATLKTFVNGAKDYVLELYRTEGHSAFVKAKSVLRDMNGPWRHGPVYLFIMEGTGYTLFHGAFPHKYEFQTPTATLRDQVTGDLILPQIIDAAKKPGGGFVKYYFDNPDDDTDSATVPKVTYAVRHVIRGQGQDGSPLEYPIIFGAGIYEDPGAVSEDVCPRPAGVAVNTLETPDVTAAQAAGSAENLKNFALAGKQYLASVRVGPELTYSRCLFRHEGPWKSGATYAATISLDGRVIFHSGNMALSGRPLKAAVWRAIAAATGAAALQTTGDFGKPDGGALPGGGYAVGFKRTVGGGTGILVAGLDIGESHLAPETVDPGDPPIRADQVVDRATLKTFVNGAKDYVLQLYRTEGHSAFTKAKSVLRDPNGPWRHGPVYLFIMEPTGYTLFHGAFPHKYELQAPTNTLRDAVTGKLILPQIIEAATADEDGGFVQYYFDNPDDDTDSATVPKVTYAVRHVIRGQRQDGSALEYPIIFGAGIYGDPGGVSEDVCPRQGVPKNPLETPSVTAAQAAGSAENLKAFTLAGRDYFNSVTTQEEGGYAGCITRNEGPWKAGPIYLSAVSLLDGRLSFNADDISMGGRPLKPEVFGAILAAVGFDVSDPSTLPAQLAEVFRTRAFPRPDGGPIQGLGGYAVGYGANIPGIMIAGLELKKSHFGAETLPPADPEVSADEVVDRRTLKKFVNGAIKYFIEEILEKRPTEAIGIARSVMRLPPWKHGSVYLFVMDPNGYTHLHAGFPNRFEYQKPTDTLRDQVTGDLILPQIIEAAQRPGGGFVQYYFDNPADDSDSADVPKVTYARQTEFTFNIPGVGPITDSMIVGAGIYGDPLSKESLAAARGWLARFGRAAAGQAVETITGRMNAPAPSGAKMTLGGQTVNLDEDPERLLMKEGAGFGSFAQDGGGSGGLARLRTANRLTGRGAPETHRETTMSELLSGGSFHLASAKDAGEAAGRWSIWGRGSRTSFEGGTAATQGDVTTAMLGMDYEKDAVLMGLALSRARGEGGFENGGSGEMEATLTSVHPYLRYRANERLSMWGILGMGQGEMTLEVEEKDVEKKVEAETDIEMRMAAFGLRGELTKMGGFDLAVKSDVLVAQTDADAADGIEALSAEATRLRVMLEASREVAMKNGGRFTPSVEAGLRHDGGDADEGLGVEVGGSLRFANPASGLTFEVRARGLLAHEEEDVTDWGVGGMIRFAPGKAGRGLALTVRPSVGETAGGAERLWGIEDASRLAREETGDLDPRVRAEVGYGLDAWGGLLTPYAGLSVSESGGGAYRLGGRFRMGERLSMSLEGDVRERENDDPVHGVALRGSLRW